MYIINKKFNIYEIVNTLILKAFIDNISKSLYKICYYIFYLFFTYSSSFALKSKPTIGDIKMSEKAIGGS